MRLKHVYVVTDPSSESALNDIFFKATIDPNVRSNDIDFFMWVVGSVTLEGKRLYRENVAVYTERDEALADAKRRLAAIGR